MQVKVLGLEDNTKYFDKLDEGVQVANDVVQIPPGSKYSLLTYLL